MDWDDDFDNGYDDIGNSSQQHGIIEEKRANGGFDPMDVADPINAYFFLSDDAQDEIVGKDKKKMKCQSCGHRFNGEIYESCPKCFSPDTEALEDEPD